MAWGGGDTLFFTEAEGRLSRLDVPTGKITTILNLEVARENQAGLMGLDVHPDFPNTPELFISYSYYNGSSQIKIKVSKWTYENDQLKNEYVLLDNLPGGPSNTGCRIKVIQDKLFITLGDLKKREIAQDEDSLIGKVLRINLSGSVPGDNPFYPSPVWTLGHRNPQGLAGSDQGIIYSSEHGAASNDEMNILESGRNYGWPWVAGFCNSSNQDTCDLFQIKEPLMAWSPTVAPAGIAYYGDGPIDAWDESIFMACLKDQSLIVNHLSSDGLSIISSDKYLEGIVGRIRDVLVTPEGRIFLCSTNEDAFGESRIGGDKIFELVEDYLYEPPDLPADTNLDEVIRLDSTILQTRILASNLFIPWDMHWGPEGWIWFSERNGDIHKINPNSGEVQDVFTIDEVYESFDNSGLHAMALHPKFPLVPYVFVNYTFTEDNARLVRYTYSVKSKTFVDSTHLIHDIPAAFTHNGSRIVFESDSIFFFALGDAFWGVQPQDPYEVNGKILRMTVDGAVPKDNPFEGSWTWSYGHRNPQGLVFSDKGILYSSEHGEATDDELNMIEKGRNYGWPSVEGFCDLTSEKSFCDANNVREPLTVWTPTEAPCGLAYFNHESIPEWNNTLLQVFLKDKELKVIKLSDDGLSILSETDYLSRKNTQGKNIGYYGRLRDVLVAPNGKIYVSTSNNEPNGAAVVKEDDDKIIELFNPHYDYQDSTIILQNFNTSIYPNPTKDYLNIELDGNEEHLRLSLIDRKGQLVRQDVIYPEEEGKFYQLQKGELRSGLYFLLIETASGKTEVTKLVFY